jgi:CHAT domain-containing protein
MKQIKTIQYYFLLAFMTVLLCVVSSPLLAKIPLNSHLYPFNERTSSAPTSPVDKGKALYDAGRFAEAVQLLQQAVQEYKTQGDNLRLAVALSNLSLAHQQLGAWGEAKQAISDSLSLLKGEERFSPVNNSAKNPKSGGRVIKNPLVFAQSLDIQGRLQLATGQAELAQATWEKAAKTYAQVGDKNGVVRSHINQAQAWRSQGFYRRAAEILIEVNQTLQSQPDSVEKAVGLRSLGDALLVVGDSEKSRIILQQGLAVAQRLKSPTEIGASLFSLGNNAHAQMQKQQAIAFYQETERVSPSPISKVQAQLNHLSLLLEDDDSKDIQNAQNLIPGIQSQLEQLPPSRAAIYGRINFAQSLMKMGSGGRNENLKLKTPNSAALLATATQQATSLGDKRAEAYALGSLGGLYEKTQQWAEAQKLTQQALILAQATNSPDISYRFSWQLGRLLVVQKDLKGAIASYDAAVETLQSLRSDLVAVNQDVQFTFRDSVEPVYRESVELLLQSQEGKSDEKTLDKVRQRIEALQLAELDNFFRESCLQGQKVTLDKVIDQDNPTAAILYPIILPEQLQVIVKIPKQPLAHFTTKIPKTEVETTLIQLRKNLVQPAEIKAVRNESQQVYNWLIKPIESQLAESGVDTLVFVLDGALRNLPMATLYDGKQYLVEKYAIALSAGLQIFNPKILTRKPLNALTAGLTQPPPGYPNYSPLPAIKSEINLIAQAGVTVTSLIDQQFTSKALEKKVNAAPFNVVHLATHGEFSSRREKTFILAADGPINVIRFDSLLRSRDENRSDAVELLFLSACQTAAGDNRAALGLAGVAIKAGARSTLASLWQIDDESTAMFVGAFYKELKTGNISKAQALRRAQLALLKHPNYNLPSYWSAYVLIGNWL